MDRQSPVGSNWRSRGSTLAETWAAVAGLIRKGGDRRTGAPWGLGRSDTIEVPRMAWRIEHEFPELVGYVSGPKDTLHVDKALQITKFRMDRAGVELASLGLVMATRGGGEPRSYAFRRPFLVALRKRGSELPYFLLWVEDPRLLIPVKPASEAPRGE